MIDATYEILATFKHGDSMRWSSRKGKWQTDKVYDGSDTIDTYEAALIEYEIAIDDMKKSDPPHLLSIAIVEFAYDGYIDEIEERLLNEFIPT
jgi:hypothetical protein